MNGVRIEMTLALKRLASLKSLCFSLALLLAVPVWSEGLTRHLTRADVDCNASQLDRLLTRLSTGVIHLQEFQLPKTVIATYGNRLGFYEGLAYTNQLWRLHPVGIPSPPTPERYLAFHLNPSIRTLLLNPARPPVGQIALGREQASSNLVAPGGFYDLAVKINPTLNPAPLAQDLLEINNFEIPLPGQPYNGFLANSTKPGRGLELDGLLSPCHDRFTDFDRHVFAVLQRLLRMSVFVQEEQQYGDMNVAIFRGEDEHTYRFNIYPLGTPGLSLGQSHAAGEIQLTWTSQGRLTSGTMRFFPECSGAPRLDCSATPAIVRAFLIPPIFGGSELWPHEASLHEVISGGTGGSVEGPATYDFEALLAGTDWNSPVP